jgi:hypothetical protein
MNTPRPFWREPMVWLVGGLPLVAVAASVALLVAAIRSGANEAVIEEAAESTLDTGARAAQLNLSAVLRVDGDRLEVLPVSGTFDRKAALHLTAERGPSAADLRARLLPSELGWQGQGARGDDQDWSVKLDAADGSWELRGRLLRGQNAVLLQPALPGQ